MLKRYCVIGVWLLCLGSLAVLIAPVASQSIEPESPVFDGTLRRIHVPILMYHYVSPLLPDADDIRVGLTIYPETFRAHMQYLHDQGYQTVSLSDLHDALLTGEQLPPRSIVLTFDDGYIDHYTNVFPVLQEFGFAGTFFVITETADNNNPVYLSWAQIQRMYEAGMSIEAHTKTHRDLRGRDYDFLVYEILGSLESIEAHTGNPAHMFAYPSGRYDGKTLEVLQQMPVWRAVTTQQGAYHTTDNLLEVTRLRISGNLSVAGLDALLRSS